MQLTIYFDGQFWVGIVEELVNDQLCVARHLFGAEPQDADVLTFVKRAIPGILNLPTDAAPATAVPVGGNPKRRARLAAAEMRVSGVSTKAQQAMQAQLDERKQSAQTLTRAQKAAEMAWKRAIKREQAKARHRGR